MEENKKEIYSKKIFKLLNGSRSTPPNDQKIALFNNLPNKPITKNTPIDNSFL